MQQQMTFKAEGGAIHCASCENRIATALGRIPGISGVEASAKTQEIQVRYDSAQLSPEQLEAKLTEIGFPAKRA